MNLLEFYWGEEDGEKKDAPKEELWRVKNCRQCSCSKSNLENWILLNILYNSQTQSLCGVKLITAKRCTIEPYIPIRPNYWVWSVLYINISESTSAFQYCNINWQFYAGFVCRNHYFYVFIRFLTRLSFLRTSWKLSSRKLSYHGGLRYS